MSVATSARTAPHTDPHTLSPRAVGGGVPTTSSSQEPIPHALHLGGKSYCASCSTLKSLSQLTTFSPKLCIELLPTLTQEQLDFEIMWQKPIDGQVFDSRLPNPDQNTKIDELYKSITHNSISTVINTKILPTILHVWFEEQSRALLTEGGG